MSHTTQAAMAASDCSSARGPYCTVGRIRSSARANRASAIMVETVRSRRRNGAGEVAKRQQESPLFRMAAARETSAERRQAEGHTAVQAAQPMQLSTLSSR